MNYVAYSNYQQLSKCFQDAVAHHQDSMLEARNIENSGHDFAASVANGLNQSPPMLEYRFLYNAQGSALFEQITAQPEYYLTRREAGILRKKAEEISLLGQWYFEKGKLESDIPKNEKATPHGNVRLVRLRK